MYTEADMTVLRTFSNRLRTEGIIWLIISIVQICSIYGAIIGVINLIGSIKTIKMSKQVLERPVGIWQAYPKKVTGGDVAVFIWNLIFGAVIGIIGSIYHINCINGYVIKNRASFERIESEVRRIRPVSVQSEDVKVATTIAD